MANQPKPFQNGDFCWIELMSDNAAQALDFYKNIFSTWEDQTRSYDEGQYTMFRNEDVEVAGLFELNDEMKQMGARPFWNSYIKVDDVDAMTAKAQELGATIMKAPFDVFEYGRMSVVADPTGAFVYLWQAKQDKNQVVDQSKAGMFCWHELLTTDVSKSKDFYTQLFGWTAETKEMQPGLSYTSFSNNGKQIAGMMQMPQEMAGAPSYWNVYFTVNDCNAFIENASNNGASVLFDPMEYPGVGRFTTLRDPQGATFSVIQF